MKSVYKLFLMPFFIANNLELLLFFILVNTINIVTRAIVFLLFFFLTVIMWSVVVG